MKKAVLLIILCAITQISVAQAFEGKGDTKFQVGLNMQDGGTGITSTLDFGLGENISFGFLATYLLNAKDIQGSNAEFKDRADVKVRFNANIGNVIGLSPKADIYPGLDLGTRNFGAHVGFRYFFTDGFGLYTEASAPLARYDKNVRGFEHYNNQFTVHLGASFNL